MLSGRESEDNDGQIHKSLTAAQKISNTNLEQVCSKDKLGWKLIMEFKPLNHRISSHRIKGKRQQYTLISSNAPTEDSSYLNDQEEQTIN